MSGFEITEWTSAADMKDMRYYIRSYEDFDVRMIDLNRADFAAKAIKYIPIGQ